MFFYFLSFLIHNSTFIIHKAIALCYSYFNASAGLVRAALIDLKLIVIKAMINAKTPAPRNIKNERSTEYAKFSNHFFKARYASGQAMIFASTTQIENSLERMRTMLETEAPITLRILISLVLCSAV